MKWIKRIGPGLLALVAVLLLLGLTSEQVSRVHAAGAYGLEDPADARRVTPGEYGLRPGDRLTYREHYTRDVDPTVLFGLAPTDQAREGAAGRPRTLEAVFDTHILVLSETERDGARGWVVATQRNLVESESTAPANLGPGDGAPLTPPAVDTTIAHANWITERGRPAYGITVDLGRSSKAVWDANPFQMLPPELSPGVEWEARPGLATRFVVADMEEFERETCARIEGRGDGRAYIPRVATPDSAFRIRYWFCPDSGLIRRLEYQAKYPGFNFERIEERVTLELVSHTRDESLAEWLDDPAVRLAALRGVDVSDRPRAPVDDLDRLIRSGRSESVKAALGVMIRDGIGVDELSDSGRAVLDAGGRPWLSRMLRRATGEAPAWLPGGTGEAEDFDVATAVALARADAERTGAEVGSCTTSPLWTQAVVATRRRPWSATGTRLEHMTSEGFEGSPYVVRVPRGYRGDAPSPLLVFLSGNSGGAMSGERTASHALRDTPYLTVYPHARGVWWDPSSAAMLDALIEEIWRRYNIDPERVYLTGLSNGGTGTFLFSSLWPQRFTAAVSAMGAGLFTAEDSRFPHPENTRSLPLRFLHGIDDDVILPGSSVETVRHLGTREAPADVQMFSDLGHEVFIGRTDDDLTLEFLGRHVGRPHPRILSYRSDDLAFPRHYWLSVVAADAAADGADGPIAVNAVVNGRRIELSTRHVRRFALHLRREIIPEEGPVEVVVNGRTVYQGPLVHSCETLERSIRLSADPHLAWTAELELDVPEATSGG